LTCTGAIHILSIVLKSSPDSKVMGRVKNESVKMLGRYAEGERAADKPLISKEQALKT